MTPLETLKTARALVANGWTQETFARDGSGSAVRSRAENAVCFCATGAISRACRSDHDAYQLAYAAIERVVGEPPATWNDSRHRTQAEVVAAFDRAIELEEKACSDA